MGKPVVHFEVMGKDKDKLGKFYSSMFDWELDFDNPMTYATVDPASLDSPAGTTSIGGGVGVAPEGMEGHVTFYVGVPDVEASMKQAESLGGTRLMGPEQVTEGVEIGMFADPEGHRIGLFKM